MSNPTKEQMLAINTKGKNIIVSAGAGSGKTFVLKERVLKTIMEPNVTVDKLIILTFTNNAAQEMKERIRKIINEHIEVKDQASLVDSAYITTFDSFSQSIVKKYSYLLNIDKNFSILDASIINLEMKKILDNIFEEYYKEKPANFNKLINDYCYKNDDDLKKCIIKIYKDVCNLYNKQEYLDNYIETHYNKAYYDLIINDYTNMVFANIELLNSYYEELASLTIKEDALATNTIRIESITSACTIDELKEAMTSTILAKNGKGVYDEEAKEVLSNIKAIEKNIISCLDYSQKELLDHYISTKDNMEVILEIINKLDSKILEFKKLHNSYEFNDIAIMAINLIKNNESVRNEIKYGTHEIMIDEYQDTNDIQDTFIKLIENNNVYMVGDIKQSIYRFRHANPYIFKEKYDNYSGVGAKDPLGYRIDLTANFRSRKEVIENINYLFSLIMTDNVGGANYKDEHQMKHGNVSYNELVDKNNSYDMEIREYDFNDSNYTDVEIESFIMANDILKRINNKEQVVHGVDGKNILQDITYSDFCVLIDKSKNFDTIKKIFEYKGIPTTIYKDISIKDDDEIYILKSLITLLIKVKNNTLDEDFKHAYMSIARSYIYKLNDNEIFEIFYNNTFKTSELFIKIKNITDCIDSLSNREILTLLIDEFDIINKIVTVGDIKERTSKLEYFVEHVNSLNKFGMDIYSLLDYFESIINSDEDIKMSGKNTDSNAVKIMTIHGSKGLEFNYVYSPFLSSRFGSIKKSNFFYSNKYGIVIPYNDGMFDYTLLNKLDSYDELKETISEKLRLFYVNITRAKEKFIMINRASNKEIKNQSISEEAILNCKSYADILYLLNDELAKYKVKVDIASLNISRDYQGIKESNISNSIDSTNEELIINDLRIDNNIQEAKHFSHSLDSIMTKELRETLDKGTYLHYIFEVYDFNNDNINELNIDDEHKSIIRSFLNHDEVKNIKDAITYKEHEIRFTKDGSTYNGVIDLLVEYDDHFDIIDYKTNNVDDEAYDIQLNGYKDYIENKYNKPVTIYLYSIMQDKFKKL